MRLSIPLLFLVVLLHVSLASAQELTLEKAIQEGKQQSPVIQKARAVVTASDWRKKEAFQTGFLPRVVVNTTHFLGHKYEILDMPLNSETVSFPTIYPTTIYEVKARIPLYDGMASFAYLDSAKLLQKAAKKELDRAEFQLEEDIRLAFYQALAAQKIQSVTAHHVTSLEEHLKLVQIQRKSGVARDYDVLRVQVQLSEAELDAADAKDNVDSAHQKLNQLLGTQTNNRHLVGDLPTPDARLVSGLAFDDTLKDRADIQSIDFRREALKKTQEAQTPWYSPKIAAIASFDLYNNRDSDLVGDSFRSAYNTGVVLNWDFLDGVVSKARESALKAEQEQLQHIVKESKLNAYADFDRWKKKYVSNTQRFKIKQLDSQRSEESVRLARLESKAGTRTNTEVLDVELDLFRSRAGAVIAQMNAVEALIKLELTLGRRL